MILCLLNPQINHYSSVSHINLQLSIHYSYNHLQHSTIVQKPTHPKKTHTTDLTGAVETAGSFFSVGEGAAALELNQCQTHYQRM
ncbi:hypothetical protein Hanom_Chr06g00518661 [Helianthus anomalus]